MNIYKPDIDAAKQRWGTFWNGTNKRPMLSAILPKDGVKPIEKPPYAVGHDGNFAPVLDQLEGWAETHEFLGEAIPYFYLEFAPDHFSSSGFTPLSDASICCPEPFFCCKAAACSAAWL